MDSNPAENEVLRRGLLDGSVGLNRVGRVVKGPVTEPFVLVDADDVVIEPVRVWLRYLTAGDHSPRTIRSYCYAVLSWFRVLWMLDVSWDRASESETAVLVGWLRIAPNPQRRGRDAEHTGVNHRTGKPNLGDGYAAATINLTLAAVHGFYEYHAHWAHGPVTNPVPASPQRRRALAHRTPLEAKRAHRRGAYRQRAVEKVPRSIPDAMWDELFARMRSDRDRALLACFVSSGARAEELLGADIRDVDWARQRISVISKGSRERRFVPVSQEALAMLGRYLDTIGDASTGPLWRTTRGPERALTYAAARRILQRANESLDTNWTLHDLRHTAAARMISSGALTLPEVQVILDHADVRTTGRYTLPRVEEVIVKVQEFYSRPATPAARFTPGYAAEDIAAVFGTFGEDR